MFFSKSALTKALNAWLEDDSPASENRKSLYDRLPSGDAGMVATTAEAKLVCAAIDKARNRLGQSNDWASGHDLHGAIGLMQQIATAEARDALIRQGLPRLRSLVREHVAKPDSERQHTLFALKVIGLYRQREDVQLFLDAIRAPIEPDSFWWQPAFYGFDAENPCTPALIDALTDPLPPLGFVRIVYLDKCNTLALGGHRDSHPFASAEGVRALEGWLTSTVEEEASYAVSACAALPFLPAGDREHLFEIACKHSAVAVQIESAWVGAKLGIAAGADRLIEFSRDPRHSARAVEYLKEVGLEQRIPAEVTEPDFMATAEMCQWLTHPNEMGRPPDAISLTDTRELYWPATKDRRQLWIFRYRYDKEGEAPDEGFGLVGSVTWAMFGTNTVDLSPEDVYGLHCAWELIQCEDSEAPPESTVAAGRSILAKHNSDFGRPKLTVV